ncbi:response regulator transcription factor [Actinophytocola sp.]|uniref:response regulator transcription factor n=1 Tax=Actinophytocola sp. TaxID=1872138 RepID=UPI003899D7BC
MFNAARRGDPVRDLSAREHDVLSLMTEGRSNAAIAEQLNLTIKTVETHIRRIFQRLGIPTEAEHHRRVLAVLACLRSTERRCQGQP